jgi:hypothetical protein
MAEVPKRVLSWMGARWGMGIAAWVMVAAAAAAPLPQDPPPAVAAAASAPSGGTRWLVGPKGSALTLEQALAKAQDGDTIELLSGEYRGSWLIEGRRLTLRGMGGDKPAVLRGEGKPVAAKALLTVRGGEVTLQNLQFSGARSNEGTGAGVRLEGAGRLLIQRCRFFDNEYGLFAANDDKAELRIEDSVFGQAPRIEGGLYHLVNIGRIARLSISGSRFQQGFEGHLIKTRARENLIRYNFIHDGLRGGASYEIDIANGGLATIEGNVIGQGSATQNFVQVAYGSEDRSWDVNRLVLAHNTFINHGWLPSWYLRVFNNKLPPGTEVVAVNNLLVGGGVFSMGVSGVAGRFEGNRHALRRMLRDADNEVFELAPGSSLRDAGVDPKSLGLAPPEAEFDWPVGVKPLPKGLKSWTPGAFQN